MVSKIGGFLGTILSLAAPISGQVVGPMVGQVGAEEARFLYRTDGVEQKLRIQVLDRAGKVVGTNTVTTSERDDFTAHFHVSGLTAAREYDYRIEQIGADGAATLLTGGAEQYHFRTMPRPEDRTICTVAFASCANASSKLVWGRIGTLDVDALFLMGDTPSIDSSSLTTVRAKHRDFLLSLGLDSLVRNVPTLATWSDHDFGRKNGNGKNVKEKAVNRKGFVEYRAQAQYGNGSDGIYGSVPCGPMEVFLLDDRWFAQTEASPVNPKLPTCFGREQWAWLLDALKKSKAPFKVIALGSVWQDKKSSENDDMQTYWHERDALFDYIRDQNIPGVVLLGGDLQVSRHLVHRQRVGYDLHDFVTSPANTTVIPSLDGYHPDLEWSSKADRQFLTITVDTKDSPAVLTAKFLKYDGTVQRTVTVPYDQLMPRKGSGLSKDLRAYWPFDSDLKNQSVLGKYLDAAEVSDASLNASGGARGGAVSFSRSRKQYLQVNHSVLPENSAQYTASLWMKPASLPAAGSQERFYLIETTPGEDATKENAGFGVSFGINPGVAAEQVNLVLYTHSLQPATDSPEGTNSPKALSQGPFNVPVDRNKLLNRWSHVTFTFDSNQLRLFLNGSQLKSFPLPIPGPLSENGGFVIGGHRGGTGRNFDGLIDEVAIWSRLLDTKEISTLWNGGSPASIATEVR